MKAANISLKTFLTWFSAWATGYCTNVNDDNEFKIVVQCRVEHENFEAIWQQNTVYIISLIYFRDGLIRKLKHRCDSYQEVFTWVNYIANNSYPPETVGSCLLQEYRSYPSNSQN